ncbi:MAG: ribosomal protein L7/L12 [Candidatus Alcyoniella australis]|nr:ribosomal protein L7/L12 [Candidatus Alcyoniella australis]
MSEKQAEHIDRSKVVMVSIPRDQDKYSVIKTLARELKIPFEEAGGMLEDLPQELLSGVPVAAAEAFAEKLLDVGAEVEVLPMGPLHRYCAFHPHNRARSKCKVCDEYICEIELINSKGKLFCIEHWDRHKFRRKLIWTISVLTLVILAAAFFTSRRALFTMMHKDHWRVAVICLTERSGPESAMMFNGLSTSASPERYYSAERHALVDLDGWFQKEYERWSRKYNDFMELKIFGLYEVSNLPPIPLQSGSWSWREARDDSTFNKFLHEVALQHGVPVGDFDVLVYVYFYTKTIETRDYVENLCYWSRDTDFVMWPLNTQRTIDFHISSVGYCMGHVMGADVHLNEHGHPKFPEGLPEPAKSQRYPQTMAELMAPYIANQQYKVDILHSLDQLAVGPYTAHELGWIDSSELGVYAPASAQ